MSNSLQKLRAFALQSWVVLVGTSSVVFLLTAVLLFRLGSLLPGYSTQELATYHAADSFKYIWGHPLNAPFEVLVRAFQYIAPHNLIAVRLASALIAGIVLIVFALLVHRWYGWRTAIMGVLLFGMSGGFLHVARSGSPQVAFLVLLILVGCGVWMREKQAGAAVTIALIVSAVLLYTPGMMWFLGIGLLLQWPTIDRAFKKHPASVTLGTAIFLAILGPLIWHFYKQPLEIKTWLCLPTDWSHPFRLLRSVIDVPLAIFFRAPIDAPGEWIGRTPLLSVFGSAMFLAGAYVYGKHFRLARVRMLVLLAILGSIVIGLSDSRIPITPLVPFIYLVVATGMGYLLDVWYEVFPRNPIARGLGTLVIAVVIGTACVYSLASYFIAWPHSNTTRDVFTVQKP